MYIGILNFKFYMTSKIIYFDINGEIKQKARLERCRVQAGQSNPIQLNAEDGRPSYLIFNLIISRSAS